MLAKASPFSGSPLQKPGPVPISRPSFFCWGHILGFSFNLFARSYWRFWFTRSRGCGFTIAVGSAGPLSHQGILRGYLVTGLHDHDGGGGLHDHEVVVPPQQLDQLDPSSVRIYLGVSFYGLHDRDDGSGLHDHKVVEPVFRTTSNLI